ncbi:shikimate dehydrogenase [Bacillus sp. FJAT-50079]|uniref:shikimate dehydrogenase n=1 Tax=Bacillus sp. FJAT-50079 TaxID=2833577 RepID=UPI001BC95891|nr:shikimate dehydrogenase [Bacillus sp. FJAT-50079]MBS4209039.1 shikimate dehydrogenase [Bacillus sp. FJAT-50079]
MMKLYGVIGDPIAQSMSPIMHNEEFKQLKVDAHYQPFHIIHQDLKTAVEGMKAIGIEGFNVTAPHKTTIMPFLDGIDPLAQAIGAVNTVVRESGGFWGYNTDGYGFIEALQTAWKEDLSNERVLIIGAGGAARAIYYSLLARDVVNVDICNRSVANAEKMIAECPYNGVSKALTLDDAEERLANYTLIIQTTSIGMYPDISDSPMSMENLSVDTFVSDIIYNPFETAILKEAKKRGAHTQNGLGMFIHQGALAFEKWTNMKPDVDRMTKIVTKQLGGELC